MLLGLCEIVMGIDAVVFQIPAPRPITANSRSNLGHDPVEHLLPVQKSKALCPAEIAEVVREILGVLGQVCEVPIGKVDALLLHPVLGLGDVARADLIADATRSAVDRDPDVLIGVETNLNEVIAASECAELYAPAWRELIVKADISRLIVLKGLDTGARRLGDLLVDLAGAHRNAAFDAAANRG